MSKNPLTDRAKFCDATILSAVWSNMSGIGVCELALLRGKQSVRVDKGYVGALLDRWL